jgi:3-oxoacyl-[acyl-carrier protein] reductase
MALVRGRLAGKVALITGAGQGIGAAVAQVFAAEGAQVLVATRTRENGQACVDQIIARGGEATLEVGDFGDPGTSKRAVASTVDCYGGIDIMVHNAASFQDDPIANFSERNLEEVFSVNLKACFRLSAACLPHFRARGQGRLLFTSSVTGPRVAMPGMSYYAASKSGMNGFIRTAALEYAREQITVNGVEPGYIRTPALETMGKETLEQMARFIPKGYFGAPDDIAHAMLFLASNEARYITGQTLVVDGGSTLPESPLFVDDLEQMSNQLREKK